MARVFSRLTFHSSSAKLNQGFQWAMRQALSYVHSCLLYTSDAADEP